MAILKLKNNDKMNHYVRDEGPWQRILMMDTSPITKSKFNYDKHWKKHLKDCVDKLSLLLKVPKNDINIKFKDKKSVKWGPPIEPFKESGTIYTRLECFIKIEGYEYSDLPGKIPFTGYHGEDIYSRDAWKPVK